MKMNAIGIINMDAIGLMIHVLLLHIMDILNVSSMLMKMDGIGIKRRAKKL
jgi:hypothetical protein